MKRKLLKTYCMFVTLVYIFFYLIKFEPKLDMKMEAFATFFLVQKGNIIYSFLSFYYPFLILCSTSILHISVNINVSNDAQ